MQGLETFKKQTTYPLEMHLSVKTTLKTKAMIKTKQDKSVRKLFPLKREGTFFLLATLFSFTPNVSVFFL